MSLNHDTERKLDAARARKPIKVLLTENGHGPAGGGSWGSFKCPFCQHPTAAGVHSKAGPDLFRCFNNGGKKHAACPSDGRSLDEVGYLALLTNSSRRDAFVMFLQQAGVWEDGRERLGPSTLPGSRPRRTHVEVEPPPPPTDDPPFCGEDISSDIDSPSEPREPAEPTPVPTPDPALTAPAPSLPTGDDEQTETSPPAVESTSAPVAGSLEPEPEAEPAEPESEVTEAIEESPDDSTPIYDPNHIRISGAEVQAWLESQGGPTQAAGSAEQGAQKQGAGSAEQGAGSGEQGAGPKKRVVVTGDEVLEAVRWFYSHLTWTEADCRAMTLKRGLTPQTQRVAGLRANRFENLRLLQAMHEPGSPRFPLAVLLKSGLWERSWDAKRETLDANHFPDGHVPTLVEGCHPARHFFGYSFTGTQADRGGEKRPTYDWVQAPLIPYFDWLPEQEEPLVGFCGITEGEFKALAWWQIFAEGVAQMPDPNPSRLLALRPHKHWSKGHTPHPYLLPPTGGIIQWHGRRMEVGVAALPGISFGRKRGGTWATRHELDEFLRLTETELALVTFDSEEKGDPALPRYNPDVEARFDSIAWGLLLARDLSKERKAHFAELPPEWRDRQGKADWDGVLARMLRKKWPATEPGAGSQERGAGQDAETRRHGEGSEGQP